MNPSNARVAFVTGANKGIGFEVARQLGEKGLCVILGARNEARGNEAVTELADDGLDAHLQTVDVAEPESIRGAIKQINQRHGRLDVLVNNAGVALDGNASGLDVSERVLRDTLQVNTLGALVACQAAVPFMKEHNYGRIVNISSTLGSLHEMADLNSPMNAMRAPAYRISKAALNAVTLAIALDVQGLNILVNSCCPGWVRTDMGGKDAPLSPQQGADTPVWLATLPDGGPSGGFFRGRKPLPW